MTAFFVITDKIGVIPLFLFSVSLHELTHLIAIKISGAKVKEIRLSILGADIKPEYLPAYLGQLFIHISAPILNFFLFIIFKYKFPMFSAVNFLIAFINLLPIGSLDGGNAVNVIINKLYSYDKKFKIKRLVNLYLGCILSCIFLYFTFKYRLNPCFVIAIILMSFENDI